MASSFRRKMADEPSGTETEYRVNLEIVHDRSVQRRMMQALRLFREELSELSEGRERRKALNLQIEALRRVRQTGFGVSEDNNCFGHIPGIQIGDEFYVRAELVLVGLHSQYIAYADFVTIDGKFYAKSIVINSLSIENEDTQNDTLIYCGHRWNPSRRSAADQMLQSGNLALCNSMEMGYPVRAIQIKLVPDDRETVYVYQGLYTVSRKFHVREESTQELIYVFELQRLPGQPKLRKRTQKDVCVLKDITQEKEKHPVGVFKLVNEEGMPSPFTYITKHVYPNWYKPVDPVGCNCINGCYDSECPCVMKNGGEIPFNERGHLRAKPTVVYECGPGCKCPPSCMNRVSQHAPIKQFEIFKTKKMGWGVRSRDFITSGSFICEYLGELLDEKEAEKRVGNDEYLFDIFPSKDEEEQLEEYQGFTLDAATYGNVGRFMNHSCSPNVFSQKVIYDNADHRFPHIMFFAGKNIPPKQELRYDYNCKSNCVRGENGNIEKKACYCGSSECSGRLY